MRHDYDLLHLLKKTRYNLYLTTQQQFSHTHTGRVLGFYCCINTLCVCNNIGVYRLQSQHQFTSASWAPYIVVGPLEWTCHAVLCGWPTIQHTPISDSSLSLCSALTAVVIVLHSTGVKSCTNNHSRSYVVMWSRHQISLTFTPPLLLVGAQWAHCTVNQMLTLSSKNL